MIIIAEEKKLLNIAEYFEMEDASEVRHEFQNGTIIEMAGGIIPHNTIKLRLGGKLDLLLEKKNLPHMVLNSDTKVRIESVNRFVYPDVTISNGTPEYYTTPFGDVRRDCITNPLVIVEVLSDNTRGYDRGEKFDLYCTVPGFQEYILIEPEKVWAKNVFLQDTANQLWKHDFFTDINDVLPIRSLGLEIALKDIYAALEKLPK